MLNVRISSIEIKNNRTSKRTTRQRERWSDKARFLVFFVVFLNVFSKRFKMKAFFSPKWFQNLPQNNEEFSAGLRSFLNNNNALAALKVVVIIIMGGGDDLKKYHRHHRGGETTKKRFAFYFLWFLALSLWTRWQISNRFMMKMTMNEDDSEAQNNNKIVLSHERCDEFDLDEDFSSTSSSTKCTCESTERGDGRGGRRGREETPQGSGFSTPVHQYRTPNNNENSVVANQSVTARTLEDLARDSRRILAAEKNANFVTKRSASRSGGKRVRPTKDKRIKPALTNKIRKKKRSVVVIAKSTSYRSYTAFQLYSAIMYFTSIECQRSKKKLEQKFPNVPYRTVLDYVKEPEKMKNIDLLTNTISNGAKPKLPKAFERMLYCFVYLSEMEATPLSMPLIHDFIRDLSD